MGAWSWQIRLFFPLPISLFHQCQLDHLHKLSRLHAAELALAGTSILPFPPVEIR